MTKKQQYKVHALTIDDALDLAGILAAGGLAGQANRALSEISEGNSGAAMTALSSLVMGALANINTRDQMRGFLFSVWNTTEDQRALEADKGVSGRLEPKYEPGSDELDKDSAYYKKLKKFHSLPPAALIGLSKAVYESDGFADFLDLVRMEIPTTSSAASESSPEASGLQSVK